MSWRDLRRVALVLVLATAAGCGIRPDPEPRAIDADPVIDPNAGSGSAATGAERIYLVAPGEQRLLRSVSRTARSAENLIETLLEGPNEAEIEAHWATQIPAATTLLSSDQQGSILYLDLTSDLTSLPAQVQPQALAQLVYTAAEVDGVEAIQITIDGESRALPTGNGQSTTSLLRTYDFPGFVQSVQPAYPALPTG